MISFVESNIKIYEKREIKTPIYITISLLGH